MIGMMIAIILLNFIAFKTNKRLTKNQIVHLWVFTMAFQTFFDVFVSLKYHGYWYFSNGVDWSSIPVYILLIPPVNIMFLNWYPFRQTLYRRVLYFTVWIILITLYELVTLLPEPWGYYHHGWWKLGHSILINPLLLYIVLVYYKWIRKIEIGSIR
ncbi:hypothetical protein KHA96_11920 [Bacillus sp. FJAT-49711]|uniref:hypothetical protein n=1 Tax=Bacillus sp. FJAT-49711 TaxID=2833585 RepID=UPI001BC94737|nr:hypothetical protein [Bacillus sp. FJAT-49711]MBS4219023.1 hypothetical protein [Bacillus sp. FJAT-49711]